MPACQIEECEKPTIARGWCSAHYTKWRKYGDPTVGRTNRQPNDQRLWAKVDKSGDCWPYTGWQTADGYGYFWLRIPDSPRGGRMAYAHRVAFEIVSGQPVPPGIEVCHTCDNPPCCNPAHLFLGTHHDNMGDSSQKGRQGVNRRSTNGRAKLTEAQITEVRARSTGRYGEISQLAREYGVGSGTMSKILKRQTWV